MSATKRMYHCFLMRYTFLAFIVSVGIAETALAYPALYTDVPRGVWYEDAVLAFANAGYLDTTQALFRPNEETTRAEFIKLVVELNGGIINKTPERGSFDDVSANSWYYPYIEEAAHEKWILGENNCLGIHPCFAKPNAPVMRAEAAQFIVRAFGFERTGHTGPFPDIPEDAWFSDAFRTMTDHCILMAYASTGIGNPFGRMNRAEMVVMLYRVDKGLTYGMDCSQST